MPVPLQSLLGEGWETVEGASKRPIGVYSVKVEGDKLILEMVRGGS